jgi:hypothetical protein
MLDVVGQRVDNASRVQIHGRKPELIEQAHRQIEASLDVRPGVANSQHSRFSVVLDRESRAARIGEHKAGLHDLVSLEVEAMIRTIEMLVERSDLFASVNRLAGFGTGPCCGRLTQQ